MHEESSLFSNSAALGTLLGSLLGGVLGFWGSYLVSGRSLIGTKHQIFLQGELKLAEFRQAWINDLRVATAELMSLSSSLGALPASDTDQAPSNERIEAGRRFSQLRFQIQLLMNRADPDYLKLEQLLREHSYSDFDATRHLNEELGELMQGILKREWEVLKRRVAYAQTYSLPIDPNEAYYIANPWYRFPPSAPRSRSQVV